MTTDNRTNEPTEVMILAGLNAYSSKGLEIDGYDSSDEYPTLEEWGERFTSQMRAALVAAAGAAPQASNVQDSPVVENLADEISTPVQPSITVDEGKIAEVISSASMDYNLSDRSGESYACGAPDYRSAFIARAVVEAIGGERRASRE